MPIEERAAARQRLYAARTCTPPREKAPTGLGHLMANGEPSPAFRQHPKARGVHVLKRQTKRHADRPKSAPSDPTGSASSKADDQESNIVLATPLGRAEAVYDMTAKPISMVNGDHGALNLDRKTQQGMANLDGFSNPIAAERRNMNPSTFNPSPSATCTPPDTCDYRCQRHWC